MIKTTSLDLSKQLKEVGYPQETEFFWSPIPEIVTIDKKQIFKTKGYDIQHKDHRRAYGKKVAIAAPTAEEILEMLPVATLSTKLPSGEYAVAYKKHGGGRTGKTLAEAAGKMFLFLKKEGLI